MNSDGRENNTRGYMTAFYMETLFLAVIFVILILILVRVFTASAGMSGRAREMTGAVQLAENAAEAVAASGSLEELVSYLDEGGNTFFRTDGSICAEYDRDMKPQPGGDIQVAITWEPDGNGYVDSAITVFDEDMEAPVYTLSTAVYIKEAGS